MKVGRFLVRDSNTGSSGVSGGGGGGGGDATVGGGSGSLSLHKAKKADRPYWLRGDNMLSFLALKGRSTPLFEELLRSSRQQQRAALQPSSASLSLLPPGPSSLAGENRDAGGEGSVGGGGGDGGKVSGSSVLDKKKSAAGAVRVKATSAGRCGRRVTLGTVFASEECAAMGRDHGGGGSGTGAITAAAFGGFDVENNRRASATNRRLSSNSTMLSKAHSVDELSDELASVDLLELEERLNNEEEDAEGVENKVSSPTFSAQSPPLGLRLMQGLDLATNAHSNGHGVVLAPEVGGATGCP